jgi:hypothetical protein
MTYEIFLEYFFNPSGTLPRHWRQRSRRTEVTLKFLAFLLFPDDPYDRVVPPPPFRQTGGMAP